MIPYGKQRIDQADIDAVIEVLKSDYVTQGPTVDLFENAIATKVNATYAVAASNATACLHLACLALGVGPGDTVWTSPISFVASANCALYCGAKVDFVDINPSDGLMCVNALAEKLAHAKNKNALPKVIIPVHLAGQSCDMEQIAALARQYNIRIIEDASHAIGATYHDVPVGSCQYSDICVFSFHPVKIITTGEGGILTTNNSKLAACVRKLRSHGITRETDELRQHDGPWYYEQQALGFNYRLTDIQAALGLSQMQKLDSFISQRNKLATQYTTMLSRLPLSHLAQHAYGKSSYHLYIITLDNAAVHKQCFELLRQAKIGVNLHYIPIHLQPYYQALGFKQGDFPNAERYYEKAISLPLYPDLLDEEQAHVVQSITTILQELKQ